MVNEPRDAVVDSWTAPVEHINYIYDNTSAGSNLRKAAVFYICRVLDKDQADQVEPRGWVEEAAIDMFKERNRQLEKDEPRPCPKACLLMRYGCQFHEHDGKDCPGDPRHQERLLEFAGGDRAGGQA